MPLRTLFFGTPGVAVPFLNLLRERASVAGVITSPDKPAGRGYALQEPAVKQAAGGLPVLQPESLRGPAFQAALDVLGPVDVGLVVAYGKLIPPEVFNRPRFGLVNVHFSLLPHYRGSAPVQWALMRGESRTGVTLFRIEAGLDTGPVCFQDEEPIRPDDTSAALRERLSERGLVLTGKLLDALERGGVELHPQAGEPTHAPILKKEDGLIRWAEQSAVEIDRLVRGTWEWPGAFCRLKNGALRIIRAEPSPGGGGTPGTVAGIERGRGFLVNCREGRLLVLDVKPEGRKQIDAWSFWNGARLAVGEPLA